MIVVNIIATITMAAMILGCLYLLIRNGFVYRFVNEIADLEFCASIRRVDDGRDDYMEPIEIGKKYSYEDFLFSLRPLKLEYWFTEEEIKILKGEK